MNILQAILASFLSFFRSKHFTGLLPDNRNQSEKEKDYLHDERVIEQPTNPFGNLQITESPYPYMNQFGTSSCVPNAVSLAYAIERGKGSFVQLSPTFIYRLRSNYPGAGSVIPNIYDLHRKTGSPLYTTLPTPQTEVEANNAVLTAQMYTEANIFKGANYFTIKPSNDIDTIAQVAQQGHGVTICLFATYDEYARQYPVISDPKLKQGNAEVSHEVCVLPYSGFVKDGVKYVAIQDSAFFGGWKLRYLSEEFIKIRVTDAKYWVGVKTLSTGPKPKHTFTQTLSIGAKSPEVKQVQLLLISEGLLPQDCATGTFGGITLAAIKAFQNRYAADILLPQGLMAPTSFWGNGCIKKANQLCT